MEYYSAIKRNKFELVLVRWVNLESIIRSEVESEREKQILYIDTYMWNLEKWYWWTYLQGWNRDTDIENRLVGTAREVGGMNWESCIETSTLPYVK